MKWASWILGSAGLAITVASWISGNSFLTLDLLVVFGLCALGGMLPLRLPGLHPLPLSLPLVGAVAVVSDATAAMTAGFLAGAFTAVAPRRASAPSAPPPSTFRAAASASSLAGILSLAAGMVASGYTRFGLFPLTATAPFSPPLLEVVRSTLFVALILWLAWCTARLTERDLQAAASPGPLSRALLASVLSAAGSLAIVVARISWDDALPLACLAGSALASLPLAARLAQAEKENASLKRRARTGLALVESIALAIEAKDHTSERHLRRMRIFSLDIGRRLGLTEEEMESLEYASLLHDVGKLIVPESILSKPASLTPAEYQVMSSHARAGAEILESTLLSDQVAEMVRHHHERYDGSGYPDGLMGMEIPIGARILAAMDSFDAMTSLRPHRAGMSASEAVAWLQSHAGTLFDPRVVELIARHHAEMEAQVAAEEAAVRARPGGPRRPLQAVLDRIASTNMEIYSLHELSQALGQSLTLDESFRLVAGKLERLLHFSACAIYLLDNDNEVLWPRFTAGAGAQRLRALKIPMGEKVTGWAAAHRQTVSTWPPAVDPATLTRRLCPDLESLGDDPDLARLTSALVAPLMVEETVVGAIALYDDAAHAYAEQDERLLAMVAGHVAGAARAGLLLEKTQENALTDSLTGLPNSRYMFMTFDQEAARARQERSSLTLMVMDIDGFREVNDDFGHHAGDRFLIGMARAIRSQMRICDTCVRYAGDEFVAILPRLGPDEIEAVVERLTDAAKDYCMEARPGRPVRLNLSIGYATMPADGEDFEGLMAVAGSRMLQHKTRTKSRKAHRAHGPEAGLPTGGRRVS